jgi:hypothetical protein
VGVSSWRWRWHWRSSRKLPRTKSQSRHQRRSFFWQLNAPTLESQQIGAANGRGRMTMCSCNAQPSQGRMQPMQNIYRLARASPSGSGGNADKPSTVSRGLAFCWVKEPVACKPTRADHISVACYRAVPCVHHALAGPVSCKFR